MSQIEELSSSISTPSASASASSSSQNEGEREAKAKACERLSNYINMSEKLKEKEKEGGEEEVSPESSYLSHPCAPRPSNPAETVGEESTDSETRLWIGNLDPRLREFHLLKMVQRYGTIDNFDFLFHRTGPNIGLPRGYAFVTFQDKEAAEKCLKSLDGTRVLDKHVAVRWAHQATVTFIDEETKLKSKLPALSIKKEEPPSETSSSSGVTKAKAISAIEAKLQAMEREKEVGAVAGSSTNFFYQYNKDQPVTTIKPRPKYDRGRNNQRRRPYRR